MTDKPKIAAKPALKPEPAKRDTAHVTKATHEAEAAMRALMDQASAGHVIAPSAVKAAQDKVKALAKAGHH